MLFAPGSARAWIALAAVIAVAAFAGISIYRRRQIERLSAQIEQVLARGREVSLANCREGDLAVLESQLSKMVGKLARVNRQLGQERTALADALADISHQIRTPLTACALMLPAIEKEPDAAVRKREIRKLEEMIERISWLVTSLLKIAKADAGAINVSRVQVDVANVVADATRPLEPALDLRGIQLEVSVQEGAAFAGDALWSAEALMNIVKNCMEHTPAGGSVRVRAEESALGTTIVVQDSGSGIMAEDLPHVFERFYRGRMEPSEGFGIGLALSQALVSVQGGTLKAGNSPDGGAEFTISFPKLII
ncbi:MAG: HAMP domain-containing histidine kinase [Eggerthellaceae bacterium]|nr:HAMP domain-containing histidine kinase [Eggerthellaceae bacterium]